MTENDVHVQLERYAASTEYSYESLAHIRRDEEASHAFAALRAVLSECDACLAMSVALSPLATRRLISVCLPS